MSINGINGAGPIKDPNNISGVNLNTDKPVSIFNASKTNFVQNTPFDDPTEQHILGLFANAQNNILIED